MKKSSKLEVVKVLGEHKHNGRTYRGYIERVVETGEEYASVRLYNAQGKFIKRFMVEKEAAAAVSKLFYMGNYDLLDAMEEAKIKALKALAGYKFIMFGYHAAIWVTLNKISGLKLPSPFAGIVDMGAAEAALEELAKTFPNIISDSEA